MTILFWQYYNDKYNEKSAGPNNAERDVMMSTRTIYNTISSSIRSERWYNNITTLHNYHVHIYFVYSRWIVFKKVYSRVVDERHTETSRRKLNMVNVAARCRLCDDPPLPPPCRLTASSDSAVRLRPVSKNTNTLIHYTPLVYYYEVLVLICWY
jgi:hypothetical protein